MNKITLTIISFVIAFTFTLAPTYATVEGIDSSNYDTYVKPIADEYGYNIGECEKEYLPGEEYFYNEYYDHWNVDKVYDETLIPKVDNKVTKVDKKTKKNKKKNRKNKRKKRH